MNKINIIDVDVFLFIHNIELFNSVGDYIAKRPFIYMSVPKDIANLAKSI